MSNATQALADLLRREEDTKSIWDELLSFDDKDAVKNYYTGSESYGLSGADWDKLDTNAKDWMTNYAALQPDFKGTTGGGWFGVDGLNTESMSKGLGFVNDIVGTYGNIVSIGQNNDRFDMEQKSFNQDYDFNEYKIDNYKNSRDEWAKTGQALAAAKAPAPVQKVIDDKNKPLGQVM